MGQLRQAKAVFLLPVRDTDGRDLSADIAAAEAAVYGLFGGWRCLGTVTGAYRMPDGSQAFDESRQYAVLLDGPRVPELEGVLRAFHRKTRQESIYLEVTPDVDARTVRGSEGDR